MLGRCMRDLPLVVNGSKQTAGTRPTPNINTNFAF